MAALLVAMAGCQKEAQPNDEIAAGDKVYMELKIQALDTKSDTDEDKYDENGGSNSDAAPDIEVGRDVENTISRVNVVLKNNDKFVVASVVSPKLSYNEETKVWLAEFNSGSLSQGESYDVYIYANCNASHDINAVSEADVDDMTLDNNFWMTNAYQPQSITIGALSTDPAAPTKLGENPHYVERSMARFDYMIRNNNEYALEGENEGITVTLTEAAIINQSKHFYLLRRATAANSSDKATAVPGFPELPTNYVVDTDWDIKSAALQNSDYSGAIAQFDYHLTTAHTNWDWKVLNELTIDDNWEGTGSGLTDPSNNTHDYTKYKIFAYVKENTLPSVATQVNGLSTGVVFKGKLSGDIIDAAGTVPIYAFDGKLYGTWANVLTAAGKADAPASLTYAVEECDNNGTPKDDATLAAKGFTRYVYETDGYYAYYYYWNRHHDNGNNKDMGDMEFAVVRNNVYKLCVDYIQKLGHAAPGDNVDPDKVENGDPDESSDYYFGVSVKVVPWVVRVNHIGW